MRTLILYAIASLLAGFLIWRGIISVHDGSDFTASLYFGGALIFAVSTLHEEE